MKRTPSGRSYQSPGQPTHTFHSIKLVRLLLANEINLADVTFAQQFDLLEGGRLHLDL